MKKPIKEPKNYPFICAHTYFATGEGYTVYISLQWAENKKAARTAHEDRFKLDEGFRKFLGNSIDVSKVTLKTQEDIAKYLGDLNLFTSDFINSLLCRQSRSVVNFAFEFYVNRT